MDKVVGFKTTYAISAYHHWSQSGRGVKHYVIKQTNKHKLQTDLYFVGKDV
jgi:hypothetical protein